MPMVAFSFSKKAEARRVVPALKKADEAEDGRECITGLEAGQVTVDAPKEEAKKPVIPCKNPLEDRRAARRPLAARREAGAAAAPPAAGPLGDQLPGGLVQSAPPLSPEDAEAMRELLRESRQAAGADGAAAAAGLAAAPVVPILMREGSKRAREGSAPEAGGREMFERRPVEGFGEALLRGMGFNPEKHSTKPVFHEKPRDNLLGLGAKALLPSERPGGPAAAKKPKKEEGGGSGAVSKSTPTGPSAPEVPESAATTCPLKDAGTADCWASRGLVVRLISKEGELGKFFGREAVVLEVAGEAGEGGWSCRVKVRMDGKSHVLAGVALADLETRVSRDCKEVRLVRGARRGSVARLVERDVKRGVARVRLRGGRGGDGATEEEEVAELPLDSVCQFMA